MLRCRTLGVLELRGSASEERVAVLSQPKRAALLAYLAVATPRGFHRRDTLLALFWPELDREHARAALRQSLTFLRRELGHDVILTRGGEDVTVNSEKVWCDAVAFEDAVAAGDLEGAFELYRGDFLTGFHVSGCGELERWVERRRSELRELAAEAAGQLIAREEQRGSVTGASAWARRRLRLRQGDERALQRLLRLLDRGGDRAGALREYDAFARQLAAEFQAEPSPETQALIAEIRAREASGGLHQGPAPLDGSAAAGRPGGPEAPARSRRRRWLAPRLRRAQRAGVIAALLVAATVLILVLFRDPVMRLVTGSPRVPAVPRWILITDFTGPSDDSTLTHAVQNLVASFCEEFGQYARVPQDEVDQARRMAEIPDSARLTVQRARYLAYRTRVSLVLDGEMTTLAPEHLAITVRAVAVDDGRVLGSISGETSSESIIRDVDHLSGLLLRQLSPRPYREEVRPREARTASFAAYRLYVAGQRQELAGEYGPAVRLARQAVEADSQFAAGWLLLRNAYFSAGMQDSAAWAMSKTVHLADQLSPREQARLAMFGPGSDADKLAAMERYSEAYPSDPEVYDLRANALQVWGRFDEAVADFDKAIALSPLTPPQAYLGDYGAALAARGRVAEADSVAQRLTGSIDEPASLAVSIASADWSAVEGQAGHLQANPSQTRGRRHRGTRALAASEAARGRIRAAEATLQRARMAEAQLGGAYPRAGAMARLLLSTSAGRQPFPESPTALRDTSVGALIVAGIRSAVAGDEVGARTYRNAAQQLPPGRFGARTVAVLDALLAASHDDWRGAVHEGAAFARAGGGVPGSVLLARWIVGTAYERLQQPDSAAAYFEMLVTPYHVAWWDLLDFGSSYSFAQYHLGRLYAELGRDDEAEQHYAAFLAAFTDPDPDYKSMVDDARASLEKISERR